MTGTSVTTTIDGDVGALRTTAHWLLSVAEAAAPAQRLLGATGSESHWRGAAADSARTTLLGLRDRTEEVVSVVAELGRAVADFADGLITAIAAMAKARATARAAGLPTTGSGIQFPAPLGGPCVIEPRHATVMALVDKARLVEAQSHEALNRVLARHVSFADYLRPGMPVRAASTGASAFTRLVKKTDRYTRSAAARARLAGAAAALAEHPSAGPAVRAAAMSELTRRLPGVIADTQARRAATALSFAPLGAKGFPSFFSLSGGVFSAAGAGLAIARGTPPEKATATSAASYAAGSATMGVAAALGVVSGPPGWIALGVSVVVSAGVGYAVDHYWEDIVDLFDHD
jgi:hypothetical protein